jgi:hypothetical protein
MIPSRKILERGGATPTQLLMVVKTSESEIERYFTFLGTPAEFSGIISSMVVVAFPDLPAWHTVSIGARCTTMYVHVRDYLPRK